MFFTILSPFPPPAIRLYPALLVPTFCSCLSPKWAVTCEGHTGHWLCLFFQGLYEQKCRYRFDACQSSKVIRFSSSQYADRPILSKKRRYGPWANPSRKPKIRVSSIDQSWDSVYFLLPAVPVCNGWKRVIRFGISVHFQNKSYWFGLTVR